jgi:hypothetical protein
MKVAKFQFPDGKVGKFEVPDDYDEARAQSEIEAQVYGKPVQHPETLSRIAGLGGRALLEGVASVPGGLYNTVSALGNIGSPTNKPVTPLTPPESIDTQKYGTNLADYFNMPTAEGGEKIPMEMARTASSFAVPLSIASKLKGIPSLASKIIGSNAPIQTATTAAISKGASEVAKDRGASPITQAVIGAGAGMGSGSLMSMAAPTARTGVRVAQSVGGYLEPLAGRTLNRQAGNEAETVQRLLEQGDISGVNPIRDFKARSSDIAGNAGISGLARFVENDPTSSSLLSERSFNNAKALKDYANKAVGTDSRLARKQDYLKSLVTTESMPMRERNLPVNTDNVIASLQSSIAKHQGNPAIVDGLEAALEKIPNGDVGFNEVYNFKQYIDDALRGKFDDPKSMQIAKAGHALGYVKKELANSLTQTEPEFEKFLKSQAIGVRQLTQSKEAKKLLADATNKTSIVSNRSGSQEEVFPFSAASLKGKTLNEKLMGKLSPNQKAIIENTSRAATAGTRGAQGMAKGSNTMQNMKMNEMIADDVTRALLGTDIKDKPGLLSNIARPLTRGISNVSGRTNEIADILARAELDPAYAASLMKKYKLSGPIDMSTSAGRAALYGALNQSNRR